MRLWVVQMFTPQLVPFKKLSKHHQDKATQQFLDKAPLPGDITPTYTCPAPRHSTRLLNSQFLMQTLSSSHGPCFWSLGVHCCHSWLCSDTDPAPCLPICSCLDTVVIKTYKHPSEQSLSSFYLALSASHKILTGRQYSQVYPDIGKWDCHLSLLNFFDLIIDFLKQGLLIFITFPTLPNIVLVTKLLVNWFKLLPYHQYKSHIMPWVSRADSCWLGVNLVFRKSLPAEGPPSARRPKITTSLTPLSQGLESTC